MDSTIALRGFDNLDSLELNKVGEIVSKSLRKITQREDYENLTIELKQHKHVKEFIHEIKATLFIKNKRISSKNSDKNLYKAIKIVLDKLLSEIEHKFRKE
jgi:ribosome-associated translation inhibitor RaiA